MVIKKCFLAGLPVIALALGLMVSGCDDGSTDDAKTPAVIDIDGINSTRLWNEAVSKIKDGASKRYRLIITGSFSVPGDTNYTFGWRKGLSVEIAGQGTGQIMYLRDNGTMLRIDADQHLTLKDITLQGKTFNNAPLVRVSLGSLSMEGSAAVSDNKNTSTIGGGVWLSGSTMTMSGNAAISGNTAYNYGGGVYIVDDSTMTMNGNAVISGNEASISGGGVYLSGSMTMNGNAVISGNEASLSGGGVYLSGSMTMNGNAAISGNTVNIKSYGYGGGGVYLSGPSSNMTMNGDAVISGNTVSGSSTDRGGGVYLSSGAFRMTGGTVYGSNEAVTSNKNTAANGGASLYLDGGTAQYGTFNGSVWSSKGTLATGNNTIKVVNGVLQP